MIGRVITILYGQFHCLVVDNDICFSFPGSSQNVLLYGYNVWREERDSLSGVVGTRVPAPLSSFFWRFLNWNGYREDWRVAFALRTSGSSL